ncbi:MAG: ATP-dependent 6-phosphofructokinase [Deltaproteobacteria bacterium]|nr:ATP-dependent 6-phosphofructokinase [Deltaproteobacteria bacterium]
MPASKVKTGLQTEVQSLGSCKITSPLIKDGAGPSFVTDRQRVLLNLDLDQAVTQIGKGLQPSSFEMAGPRRKIYFDPAKTKAAIVTCGGLCPGINSVVRSVVLGLYFNYGVRNILGIKFGFQGFIPSYGHEVMELTPKKVVNVHGRGGNILGMSRGPQDVGEVVDALERLNISILYAIGGDGTLRATHEIAKEIADRRLKTAVVAVPKTIDNDIAFVSRTFGFDTAVAAATLAISSAHNEATCVPNGVGLVKLMGRYAGFVAAQATLALADVNFCLIPEVPFDLEGDNGLLNQLVQRIKDRAHAVIVVTEGAGQHLFEEGSKERDASGNVKLMDIGPFLKGKIINHFNKLGLELNLKYIDPSYIIRSVPANPTDQVFCGFLGHHAVHAGLAGKTDFMVSAWNNSFVHVPLAACTAREKRVNPQGHLWRSVREVTGQSSLVNA